MKLNYWKNSSSSWLTLYFAVSLGAAVSCFSTRCGPARIGSVPYLAFFHSINLSATENDIIRRPDVQQEKSRMKLSFGILFTVKLDSHMNTIFNRRFQNKSIKRHRFGK